MKEYLKLIDDNVTGVFTKKIAEVVQMVQDAAKAGPAVSALLVLLHPGVTALAALRALHLHPGVRGHRTCLVYRYFLGQCSLTPA